MAERRGMAIQSAEYDAVIAAIDEFGRATWLQAASDDTTPRQLSLTADRRSNARAALCKAIDAWATARDAAIRAEERTFVLDHMPREAMVNAHEMANGGPSDRMHAALAAARAALLPKE